MKSKYIWWTLYQCNIHNTTFYVLHKVKIHFNNFHWEHVLVFKILTLFTRINDTSRKTNFVPYYTRYYDKYLPLQLTVISYISSQHDFPPVLTHTNVFRPLTSTSPPTPVCHPWSFASLKADSHIACRAHVMLRPCRSPQGHSTAWPSLDSWILSLCLNISDSTIQNVIGFRNCWFWRCISKALSCRLARPTSRAINFVN